MKHEQGKTTLNPWSKGVNNRASVRNLPEETVRNAVNTDFGTRDQLGCRPGMTKVLSAVNPQGGFSCPLGRYFVEGADLKTFNTDYTATTIYRGITGTEFAYDYLDGLVYFSDGVVCLKISSTEVSSWGVGPPATPQVTTTTGAYDAGTYLIAYCFVDTDGVESGCSSILALAVGNNTGFIFAGLVAGERVYMSTADGKELYHVTDAVTTTYTLLAGRYDEGNICESQFISPPPPGRLIWYYKGRRYVATSAGTVWYSEPFEPDRFKLGHNFLQFQDAVDVALPVTNGIFFAYGNKTDFYAGTPEEGFTIARKFEYGGVYGTGKKILNSDNVSWQSQRGMVIGTADGQCKNMQEDNVAVESAVSGATLIKEKEGMRQYIASLQQPTASPLAATSWIDAEIVRRGA